MRGRNTIILLIVLAAIIVFISLTKHRDEPSIVAPGKGERIFTIDPADAKDTLLDVLVVVV